VKTSKDNFFNKTIELKSSPSEPNYCHGLETEKYAMTDNSKCNSGWETKKRNYYKDLSRTQLNAQAMNSWNSMETK